MILSIIPTFIDHIISAASITSPEQLRGKIGSVNRFGSISEMGPRLSLKQLGIDPEKDVRIVPAGGNPERLAAISKGIAQFTIMNEPFIKEAERLGFRDLVNMATLKNPATRQRHRDPGGDHQGQAPRGCQVRACHQRSDLLHQVRERSHESDHRQVARFTDPEGLERTYKNYTAVLLEIPYADPAGIKTLLDDMVAKNAKAAAADPKSFVDSSFVQEMESSGFIKQLYKR